MSRRESGWYWCDECDLGIWTPIYYNANHSPDSGAWMLPGIGAVLDQYVDFPIDERRIVREEPADGR